MSLDVPDGMMAEQATSEVRALFGDHVGGIPVEVFEGNFREKQVKGKSGRWHSMELSEDRIYIVEKESDDEVERILV